MKQNAFLVFSLISLGSARSFGAERFQYSIPPEFTALSTSAPSTTPQGLPPAFIQRAREFDTYAVALKDGAPVAELTVTVGDGAGTVMDSVEQIAKLAADNPEFRLLSKGQVTLNLVPCGRVEFTAVVQGVAFQKLAYVLPLGTKRAWVALEATPTEFPLLRSGFEKSVAAASGLSSESDPNATGKLGAILLAGALGGVAFRQALRSRSSRRARSRTTA